jgi:DNA-binding XRE family transcriptional regulator
MAELEYRPVAHDHEAFIAKALRQKGFAEAYDERSGEYALVRELLRARLGARLTQAEVARRMGTTKSAVSRLESAGSHSPSVATLRRYAQAVGRDVEIRFVPALPHRPVHTGAVQAVTPSTPAKSDAVVTRTK